ncbi:MULTISPECIES: CaiB/BaiF CoA transferase family protein [Paenibacillus]|uniref:Crotonobetainyl-CoA:carnitine CoA-transferase n=1 Tax=Paenibacillus naphthalenovorans TaxID=162209 RepID=A0A0U2WFN7_9BACL|nr:MULTISPECIES: CoA transferase [Paenibacillus]ALS25182.1 crotonobetainyl-CoA:carnitine CoA-transferase [Paenibacillus naphthalenovorans]NTZ20106.1 CoA transferase [Paenibacillus sp. JMULE4]GCL73292.1 CoA transferase [Paenibacillus naphthalenovorans]SDI33412.1 formyl-CoA transferase [Paenibacillus naphthalenovorans]
MDDQKRGELPLAGLRVVDASTILAGPMLATYLGDFGAEVIKVEHPSGDPLRNAGRQKEGKSLEWKLVSRNKKPITLNLGKPEGQELFMKLAETADIVITNFRPQTLKKWGITYETLSARNPGLILVQVSGFGVEGPYSDRPGFGTLAEALSGFAEINGYPDRGPLLPNLALADQATALLGAYATMVAVYERDHSGNGKGQFIDLPIYEALMGMLGNQVMEYDQLGILQKRMGNRTQWTVPRNLYQTSDGKWVAISGSSQPIVERILKAVEREDLITDPRFKDNQARLQHAEEIDGVIAEWMSRHTQSEVLARFHECDATIAPTYTIEDIFKDPHFRARGNIVEVPDGDFGKVKMLNTAPKFSRTPGRIRHSGLEKGACNDEVFGKLGLSKAALDELKKNEII